MFHEEAFISLPCGELLQQCSLLWGAGESVTAWSRKYDGCFSIVISMKAYLQRESLWWFPPQSRDCTATAAALLVEALKIFILLTADCLGDRYWWVQDGVPCLQREHNLHKHRRKRYLLECWWCFWNCHWPQWVNGVSSWDEAALNEELGFCMNCYTWKLRKVYNDIPGSLWIHLAFLLEAVLEMD